MNIPSWLPASFERAVMGLGATAPLDSIRTLYESVIHRWNAPGRLYHGLTHVTTMLANAEKLLSDTCNPNAVRLAVWYHGIVFDTSAVRTYTKRGGEDELKSAQTAQQELESVGVSSEKARRVAELIWALPSSGSESLRGEPGSTIYGVMGDVDVDISCLKDAHMSIVASPPQVYRKYSEQIRKEYAHIPLLAFMRGRLRIISRLLERKKLFITPLGRSWEHMARQNLQAEAEVLKKKISQCEMATDAGASPLEEESHSSSNRAEKKSIGEIRAGLSSRKSVDSPDDNMSSLENAAERLMARKDTTTIPAFPRTKNDREKVTTDFLAKINARNKAVEMARDEAQVVGARVDSPLTDKALAEEFQASHQTKSRDSSEAKPATGSINRVIDTSFDDVELHGMEKEPGI